MIMGKCDTCGKKKYGYLCDGCIHDPDAMDKYEPMTNADRIRAMSDEELSVFLWEFEKEEIARATEYALERRKITEWLKQPAEVDNG
jgi:hypothetical protein